MLCPTCQKDNPENTVICVGCGKPLSGNTQLTIRTSEPGWFGKLAGAYKNHTPTWILDDAGIGIDPLKQTLGEMGRTGNISQREWIAVLTALGMSSVGAVMIWLAYIDPELTSKLWLLVAGGTTLVFTGGFQAIRILVKVTPPHVEVTANPPGFIIKWD